MMRFSRFAAPGLSTLLVHSTLIAQSAGAPLVRGMIRTDKGEPVQGAQVEIRGLGIGTATRADGSFRLENVAPGRYWVTVTGGGVEPGRKAITVGAEPADRMLDFHLNPVPGSHREPPGRPAR